VLVATVAAVTRALSPALGHSDSINGPAVSAAREARDIGDIDLVLSYVQPDAEADLTPSFEQTREVLQADGAAQDQDEAYTELSEQNEVDPSVVAAEQALESGSTDEATAVLEEAVRDGVAAHLAEVQAARERAAHEGTVAANRGRVERELAFE
jgi:hypothetical protein